MLHSCPATYSVNPRDDSKWHSDQSQRAITHLSSEQLADRRRLTGSAGELPRSPSSRVNVAYQMSRVNLAIIGRAQQRRRHGRTRR
jgi:hypothetical protein